MKVDSDSIRIDSVSIEPSSFRLLYSDSSLVDTSYYQFDGLASMLFWKGALPQDSLIAQYRVFPIDFSKRYRLRSPDLIQPESEYLKNPFTYRPSATRQDAFGFAQLTKTGSISRGVGFGNNQDLTVNSTLSLQLNGQLTEDISILASITDDNIPIQPDGNTAQLQEFDQVYIQLYDDRSKLTVGDFILQKPIGYFTSYFKRAQGASFSTERKLSKSSDYSFFTETSAAVSKGKFNRQILIGTEGSQ